MFGSQALEVAIGLTLVFFLFAAAASSVVEVISALYQKRAKDLEDALERMLGGPPPVPRPDVPTSVASTSVFKGISPTGAKRGIWPLKFGAAKPSYLSAKAFADSIAEIILRAKLQTNTAEELYDALPQGLRERLKPILNANGSDLASGNVPLVGGAGLSLHGTTEKVGADVWTYGYPLTSPPDEDSPSWKFDGRFLQGYVTRHVDYGEARIPSYELDMRAPEGLSGAPIMLFRSTEVVGVVYGVTDVRRIEEWATVDPDTGEPRPEIQRVESFALAHQAETLANLAGAAMEGKPLKRFLADSAASAESDLARLYGR